MENQSNTAQITSEQGQIPAIERVDTRRLLQRVRDFYWRNWIKVMFNIRKKDWIDG